MIKCSCFLLQLILIIVLDFGNWPIKSIYLWINYLLHSISLPWSKLRLLSLETAEAVNYKNSFHSPRFKPWAKAM